MFIYTIYMYVRNKETVSSDALHARLGPVKTVR